MFWKSYFPILVAQAALAFAYIGWPVLRRFAAWAGRRLASAWPVDEEIAASGFESRAKAGMEQHWGPHSERFAQAFSEASSKTRPASPPPPPPSPPPPPAPPLTPRSAHLRTLGLSGLPDSKALRMAYRKLAKTYHPDQYASPAHSDADRRRASERMSAINAAYDWLVRNA